ncbi:Tn3 family transposase [Streptomyces sp. NBC_00029]|uniref:Tn3 family transposase n=1 Tax=Streptomyces sp. NBC_00029 TaxID=2903613 RepID=UPI0038688DAF
MRLDRIRAHWGDMLRVAGSLTLGEVRGHDLIRMLSPGLLAFPLRTRARPPGSPAATADGGPYRGG